MLQNKWPVVPCTQQNANLNMEKPPAFSQIYIYEHELDYHMKAFTGLDASLLLELQQMIKNVNCYAHKYLQVAETIAENPTGDIKLVLRSPGK